MEKLNYPRATVPEKARLKYVTHAAAGIAAVSSGFISYTVLESSCSTIVLDFVFLGPHAWTAITNTYEIITYHQ